MALNTSINSKNRLLNKIQRCIEELYDLNLSYNVSDFVTTNSQFATHANQYCQTHSAKEQLYVMQEGDYLDISLFLDQSLLDQLVKNCPFNQLTADNLSAFWVVLEGVSHFCYLTWNAAFDRTISRLEMELQAEIDKFICTSHMLHKQADDVDHEELWKQLFRNYHYHHSLSNEQRTRYVYANHYASLYCTGIRNIENRLNSFKHIRRFYRLRENDKINFISSIGRLPGNT